MGKDVRQSQGLVLGEAMLLDDHIPADRLHDTLFDLSKLGDQAIDEELQSASQVHVSFSDALSCLIKGSAISVAVFANRKQWGLHTCLA